MKKLQFISAMLIVIAMCVTSCDLIDEITDQNINPDETVAKEGNMWEGTASGYPAAKATITSNDKGFATVTVNYDGKDYFVQGRVSKTKIEDFVYSNGDLDKPFTLCDFDAKVGDKWEYTVGTQKVVREVIHKSTEDDWFALGLMVKVSRIEETIPEGLTVMGYPVETKKIVWTFNHKFGFIGAEVTKTDNSVVNVYLTDTNAGSGK